MTKLDDVMAMLKEVEAKAEEIAARQARLTDELRQREDLFAVRLHESRQMMRDDFASLLRSVGANDEQVIAALEAFDEESLEHERVH